MRPAKPRVSMGFRVSGNMPSDDVKLTHLGMLLALYEGANKILEEAETANYNFDLRNDDGKRLYTGEHNGDIGTEHCGSEGGPMPFSQFVQDVVAARVLFGIPDSPEARVFEERLAAYAKASNIPDTMIPFAKQQFEKVYVPKAKKVGYDSSNLFLVANLEMF